MKRIILSPILLSAFEANYIRCSSEQCWPWIGHTTPDGYGCLQVGNVREYAHRVAYFKTFPGADSTLCVLHTCDNPSCVNPAHLFLGTKVDNNLDRDRKERQAIGIAHGRAILTEAQVLAIRFKVALGIPHREIAKEYNVGHALIWKISIRRVWKHLP